jgi:hypothetical protein
VIYLDSSGVVKLIRVETSTAELVAWLGHRESTALVSSALAEVEVPRALRRHAPAALEGAQAVLSRLYIVEIDATVRATAAAYDIRTLRSLDAIHLASAELLARESEGLEALVAYDERLLDAATSIGLPAVSPGLD